MPRGRDARIRLHLDADSSRKALHRALVDRGHDVTRTPSEWMPLDAKDRVQLREAAARGRVIFTFNIRDFVALHRDDPDHSGILLAAQRSWKLSGLIEALDRFLDEHKPSETAGRLLWLRRIETGE